MRTLTLLLTLAAAMPLAGQRVAESPSIGRTAVRMDYTNEEPYHPVRSGEVRSGGFLTEMRSMPYGAVLGPVTPHVLQSTESSESSLPGTDIAIRPPAGASYRRGDTVMLARVVPAPAGWGDIVIPTGLARIGDMNSRQTIATIIVMYGPVRLGQVALPLEPVSNPGAVVPVPSAGPSGEVLVGRETRELEQVGGVLYVNMGTKAGVRVGDFVEVRRRAGPRLNAADTRDEVIATAQVIHVNEKSSTIRLVRIIDPVIRAGAPVVRISTLPN